MRPSLSIVVVVVVVVVVSSLLCSSVDKVTYPVGTETRSTVMPNIWSSYADAKEFMPDCGCLSLTMSNPAWLPLVSPLGVPMLTNGPGNGPLAQNWFNTAALRILNAWTIALEAMT